MLKTPCNQCPFKKDSLKGYLGASTPVEFLEQAESDIVMPCHLHIDYEDVNLRNRCKSPRNNVIQKGDSNKEVFDAAQEFYNHHSDKIGIVMIVGNRIIVND